MDSRLKNICLFCNLLNYDCFKKELEDCLNGFDLDSINIGVGTYDCYFSNGDNDKIVLMIMSDEIYLNKIMDGYIEQVHMSADFVLTKRSVLKGDKGIIYSVLEKEFKEVRRFKNKKVLIRLSEDRMVFSNDTVNNVLNRCDIDTISMNLLLLKLKKQEKRFMSNKSCDFYTSFDVYMNFSKCLTFLNGKNLETFSRIKGGSDKLYRIYDLYSGIINGNKKIDATFSEGDKVCLDISELNELMSIVNCENTIISSNSGLEDTKGILEKVKKKCKKLFLKK